MLPLLGSHVVTVVRPAGTDPFSGDPLPGVTETDVHGCFVQPRTSTERTDQRDQVDIGLIAFMPPDADVVATDRIRWNGTTFQVEGVPARWSDINGTDHHIEVPLRRLEG